MSAIGVTADIFEILARGSLSANDPKRTSGPHYNGLSRRLPRSRKALDFQPVPIGGWVLACCSSLEPEGPKSDRITFRAGLTPNE
jgi:hypothetical protein